MVSEAIDSPMQVKTIVLSNEFDLDYYHADISYKQCNESQMNRISNYKNPPGILAVVQHHKIRLDIKEGLTLVLDQIQDPGNLGTILRTSEGMGIKKVICSSNSVDAFSPKVVQASMGSILRLEIHYEDLKSYLEQNQFRVYAAMLSGENLYQAKLQSPAILLMGNESNGVSKELLSFIDLPITIPMQGKIESYNLATATALVLSQFQVRSLLR